MDNQEIDKLFRETTRDFREDPDPRVWTRIRASLDREKNTRRLVPLWYRWGIAASLLLGALFLLAPWDALEPAGSPVPDEPSIVTVPESREESPVRQRETLQLPEGPARKAQQGLQRPEEDTILSGKQNLGAADTGGPVELAATAEPIPASTDDSLSGPLTSTPIKEPGVAELLAVREEDRERQERSGNTPLPIGQSAQEESATTSLAQAPEEKPSIFEALESSEDPHAESRKGPRWSMGPSLAPVYFGSFGDGSPISPSFVANEKSGSFNMSYGLQVSYGVSKKLSVRTGIHRVDYGYNTEEIGFTASPVGSGSSLIRTINYSENSRGLVVKSMVNGSPTLENEAATDVTAPSPVREGRMVQEFGYLEIPLEMQYTLIDKAWGVHLIGGMSSLFLVDNSVSLESSGAVTEVGESTNMNSLNFSTNFGLGLYYRVSPKVEFNVLPMFKYQLNTFSNTAGNFRPYSVGVYSGLSFRF